MSADKIADQAKAVFEQNFAQYRMLNEQLNRIPPFAVTLTGGFWYIAVVIQNYGPLTPPMESLARFAVMVFCGLCNLMLILIAIRVRDVMRAYEAPLMLYAGADWPNTTKGRLPWLGDYSMIGMYCAMMLAGSILSLIAAAVLFWPAARLHWAIGVGGSLAVLIALFTSAVLLPKLGKR